MEDGLGHAQDGHFTIEWLGVVDETVSVEG
jgi:hypothetical protein